SVDHYQPPSGKFDSTVVFPHPPYGIGRIGSTTKFCNVLRRKLPAMTGGTQWENRSNCLPLGPGTRGTCPPADCLLSYWMMFTRLKIGRYRDTTITPTIPPMTTIMSGSIREASARIVASIS